MAGVTRDACWDGEELLSAYLDGELAAGELDEVVAHLESCAACLGVFRAVKEARAAVRMLPMLEPPGVPAWRHGGTQLSAYLDGELPTEELDRITGHLGECSDCRDELHELDAARTAVRALPRMDVPLDVVTQTDLPPSRRRWVTALVAAAALLAATLGVAALRPDPVTPLDLDNLANRHNVRVSVEAGFSVIPSSGVTGGGR